MKKWLGILLLVSKAACADAQNIFITKKGQISFFSKTSMENIDARNNEVSSVLNTQTAELAFAVLIKGFHFELEVGPVAPNFWLCFGFANPRTSGEAFQEHRRNLCDTAGIAFEIGFDIGRLAAHRIRKRHPVPNQQVISTFTIVQGISGFNLREWGFWSSMRRPILALFGPAPGSGSLSTLSTGVAVRRTSAPSRRTV